MRKKRSRKKCNGETGNIPEYGTHPRRRFSTPIQKLSLLRKRLVSGNVSGLRDVKTAQTFCVVPWTILEGQSILLDAHSPQPRPYNVIVCDDIIPGRNAIEIVQETDK
jgi:hypothetical protein